MKPSRVGRRVVRASRQSFRSLTRQGRPVLLGALILGTVLSVGLAGAVAGTTGPDQPGESHHVVTQQFDPGPDRAPLGVEHDPPGGDHDGQPG